MQRIFQNTKKLIATCLVTVLLATSTLLSLSAPARADIVIFKCETDCGNMAAFSAGVISGSAVTLAATGGSSGAAATGLSVGIITTAGHIATTVAAPLVTAATPAVVAAAPIVVPVAATAAVGYGAYRVWENHHNSQAQPSK